MSDAIKSGGLPPASQAATEAPKASGYKKDLGTWSVVFLAIGAILGPAVAYAPVFTVAYAGPIGILSWFVAMAMLIPVGLLR